MGRKIVAIAVAGFSFGAWPALSQPAAQSAAATADDDRRVICRSERIIGSISRRRRTCLTRRGWQDLLDRQRREQADWLARATETACPGTANLPQCAQPFPTTPQPN